MEKSNYSPEESIEHNLRTFTFEVGSQYEVFSRDSVELFDRYITSKRVIDLGCGDGAATKRFLELGYDVTGVDINNAKLMCMPDKAILIRTDFVTYLKTLADNSQDNIFCHHALEHFSQPEVVLAEISRVLKPGGWWFCAVPRNDGIYSVHHASFENVNELIPPNCQLVFQDHNEAGWRVICQK